MANSALFLLLGVLPCSIIWHIKIYKRSLISYWIGRLGTIFIVMYGFWRRMGRIS